MQEIDPYIEWLRNAGARPRIRDFSNVGTGSPYGRQRPPVPTPMPDITPVSPPPVTGQDFGIQENPSAFGSAFPNTAAGLSRVFPNVSMEGIKSAFPNTGSALQKLLEMVSSARGAPLPSSAAERAGGEPSRAEMVTQADPRSGTPASPAPRGALPRMPGDEMGYQAGGVPQAREAPRAPLSSVGGPPGPRARGALAGALPVPGHAPTPPLGPYPEDAARDMEASSQGEGMALQAPTVAPEAASARQGLAERYRERVGQRGEMPAAGMNPEQKKQALLEAGLAIMAAASKPGASMLGSVGEGGLKGTAVMRELERVNREHGEKRRTEQRDDDKTELTLADKDEDNVRGDRAQAATERHQIRTDATTEAYRKRYLDIEEKKLKGLMDDRAAKNALTELKIEMQRELGKAEAAAQIAKIEAAGARAQSDPVGRAMESLRKLFPTENNDQLFKRYQGRSTDPNRSTFDEGDIAGMYKDAVKAAASNPGAEPVGSFEQYKKRVIGVTGGGKPGSEAEAHSQAKQALSRGAPKAEINKRLQEWGYKAL